MEPAAELIPEALLRRCFMHVLGGRGFNALGYAPAEGTPLLREQIARDLVERGVPARAEEVIVTSGSQQGLDLIARALLNPGDTLLVEPTTYAGAIDLFTLAGARLVPVPMDGEGPDLNALDRLVRPEVKGLYLMPNAHNPTGRTLGTPRRRALLEWSRASGVPIIEDDYAAGIVLEEAEAPPHLRALDGDVIHVSTYSKRLAPALRVGYIVAPPALRPVLMSIKRVVDLGTSATMQLALGEFMERGYLRAHGSRMRQIYRTHRDALSQALRRHLPAAFQWQVPSHGVVLWLRLPEGVDPERVSAEAQRRGVLVSPSPLFAVGARAEPAVRLIFSAEPAERLVEGAERLGKAVEQVLAERASAPPTAPEPSELI
jgi:DNA-binding transcriptional MocR family regulator